LDDLNPRRGGETAGVVGVGDRFGSGLLVGGALAPAHH